MKIVKMASVAVAALVGVGSAVAMAHCGTCGVDDDHAKTKGDDKAVACPAGACAVEMNADAKGCPVASKEAVVNTEGLATLINSKVPLKIFDARSGKYDDGQRLSGAQQLSADADEAVISKAIPDKSALVVTYCAGLKCPASKALADRLKKLGYTNVIEYPQGIAGWLEAGKAVDKK
ncbi:MAG: rhodanese-like domain-containing protein [bacterium]